MKLAEALLLRSEHQKKLEELEARIQANLPSGRSWIAAFDRRRTGGSAMKLAEALLLRSEHQKKLEELEARIQANLKVQEGDELQEDPEALLQAAMAEQEALCALVRRINRTNHALHLEGNMTHLEGNMTLSDALAERDMLRGKRALLARVAESARNRDYRLTHSEVKMRLMVDQGKLQKEIDALSKQFRELDTRIQGINWTSELLD